MDLRAFAAVHGIVMDREPRFGVWCRYKTTDKPKHRNGAIKFLGTHAFVQNHALSTEVAVWQPDKPLPPLDVERMQRKARAQAAEDARARAEAIQYVRRTFASLPRVTGMHPYLEDNGLTMRGCSDMRIDSASHGNEPDGDKLVIPMWRHDGALMSWQRIAPDGSKTFKKHAPPAGCAHQIGAQGAAITVLCEGVATGLAIYQSLPSACVVVAFTAGNLARVAGYMRVRGAVVVAADNDHETAAKAHMHGRNPGIEAAAAAAEVLGCQVAYPDGIRGSDWADALREWGERGAVRMRMLIQGRATVVAP